MPLLSVLMSTYKDAAYIEQSMDAILSQSFTDFEFLIVNDASPDRTEDIIGNYLKKDHRIKYFRNARNQGIAKNINFLSHQAMGEFLYLGSSDDWITPYFFEEAITCLKQSPHSAICFLDTTYYYAQEKRYEKLKGIAGVNAIQSYMPHEVLELFRKTNFLIPTCSAVVRKQSFIAEGCYPEQIERFCDLISYNIVAAKGGCIYVPGEGTIVRILPENIAKMRPSLTRKIKDICDLFNYFALNREPFKLLCSATVLPKFINYKLFFILLLPKYWKLVPSMSFQKIKLLLKKIKRKFLRRIY